MTSDSEPEMFSSDRPDPDIFDMVPANKDYKLRVGDKKLGYVLKKDKLLPYTTTIKGLIY